MVLPSSVNAVISALDRVQMQKDIMYLEETCFWQQTHGEGKKDLSDKGKDSLLLLKLAKQSFYYRTEFFDRYIKRILLPTSRGIRN